MTLKRPFRIAIVAGELSGDLLGAGLIYELKKHLNQVEFIGVGGPRMVAEGFQSLYDMKRLSVMGITDVLRRYPELYRIRQNLIQEWNRNPPDLFIGIDYTQFNLQLEQRLKHRGIKTVHIVSPKIWAWRQKRVLYIKKAVDLVLTLFPFEEQFYQKHGVPSQFIGHPLADQIPLDNNSTLIRQQGGFDADDEIVAVLPGSRAGELKYMMPLFLDVMKEISLSKPKIHFILPMANFNLRNLIMKQIKAKNYNLNLEIIDGRAQDAIIMSNVVLAKSGTATLEAMLLKRPMVVAFKWSFLTHLIIAPQLKIPSISLPNILANEELVPEFIQNKARCRPIAQKVLQLLNTSDSSQLTNRFLSIHKTLRQNANEKAALAILKVLGLPCTASFK
ncbi:lipid-A-disaccharide synthase [Legionella antarctica]|uniref:lipid-A-disaccharide synthase n=1 Tax=Legionella antarctica TaxID=2708020 RepID=UPI001566529B|nr:lipid-A-disaccharide synthase [Legionella antarctica]